MTQIEDKTTEQPNLGPGQLQKEGDSFILTSKDWYNLQTFIENGLNLPINEEQMRRSLGLKDPNADVKPFHEVIAAYNTIHNHCLTWKGTTYPNIVMLANDIVHYSTKVSTYYDPLYKAVADYQKDPTDQLKRRVEAIIASLAKDAKAYTDRAEQVEADIQTFEANVSNDRTVISNLEKDYESKYGETSQEVEQLKKELEAQKKILEAANEEYNRDVIIASTTPAYLLIPFIGWIAGPIVAGTFGDMAVKALKRAEEAQQQINEIGGKITRDTNLMELIKSANTGIHNILENINAALKVIGIVKGAWSAIHSDLEYLQKILHDDIEQAIIDLMDIGIDEAKAQWIKLGQEADAYRVNAFVTFDYSTAA